MSLLWNGFVQQYFNSIDTFQCLAFRALRMAIITVGTGSVVYALIYLPKLREQKQVLEQCTRQRLSLETCVVDRTINDKQWREKIDVLHFEYDQLCRIYHQLDNEEIQLNHTIECEMNNRQEQQPIFTFDEYKSDSEEEDNEGDNDTQTIIKSQSNSSPSLVSTIHTTGIVTRETLQTINSRSKRIFARIRWLKKRKDDGDG